MSHSDYDSPFRVVMQNIANSVATRIDEEVGKVFVETAMSINVDKDKLMEIMKQDRSRYVEAYQHGYDKRESEIVRCKDCWKKGNPYFCIFDRDSEEYGGHRTEAYDDWFCADGERRQDDD